MRDIHTIKKGVFLKTRTNKLAATLIALVVLGIGYMAVRTIAASFLFFTEAEQGPVSGSAAIVNDATASGGKAVHFKEPSPPPTPPLTNGRPNSANTGVDPNKTLPKYTGGAYNDSSNITLDGLDFPAVGGGYTFAGNNVTIRNSKFASGILFNGDNVRLENNDIVDGISLSGTAAAVIDRNEIRDYGADGIHITSDSGQVSNVTVTNNFIRSPTPEPGAHADGVQVRGVNGLTFTNNAIDMGVWKQVAGQDALNAAIFLEDANGGNSNITLNSNYLNGGGYILRIGAGPNQQFINNRFGPDGRYGVVHNIAKPGNITANSGNVMDLTNQPVIF